MATVYPYIGGTPSKARFENSSGLALSGGKIYFYQAGTTTPKDTYSESTGTTANANPVILDSRGEADIFLLGDGAYKVTVKDSSDVLIYTVDNVRPPSLNESAFAALTALTLPVTGDSIPIYDLSATLLKTITLANLLLAIPLRGHIAGLTLSNNVADATNDIDIAVGECTDSSNTALIKLTSSITKRLDAAWAVGTNQGGLDTGAIANDVYHLWLIRRSDTGVVDALFSASATSPTMPTSYDQKRRIGAVIRAGATILAFTQFGDHFRLSAGVADIGLSNPGATAATRTLATVPDGVRVKALLNVSNVNTAVTEIVYFSELAASDQTPSNTLTPLATLASQVANVVAHAQIEIMTNTSAQIRTRNSVGDANTVLRGVTHGWTDYRGKND